MIKDNFSINIKQNENINLFHSLIELFRPYYHAVGRIGSFDEIISGEFNKVELLPPFEVIKNQAEIHRLLFNSDVPANSNTTFAWEHLKDHLNLCAYLVSSRSIQIIPPIIPISNLTYFQESIRRVYLSATMLTSDSFIRTFGQELDYVVEPATSAGQCERLILFPEQVYGVDDDRYTTKEFISDRKTLILVPSYHLAESWNDVGHVSNNTSMIEDLVSFKGSTAPNTLVLTARYDGIDLPGDTCRHLVMDGLPTGTGLLDRYMWESLRLSNILRSTIACRIIQSLGRISRGMSDHGVVIVIGREYVKWLLTPRNQAYLPPFVQKQIKLGLEVSENCNSADDISPAANACLNRDINWINAYEQFMDDCDTEAIIETDEILKKLALAETSFIKKYWDRDYSGAIKILDKILVEAFSYSSGIGSWYALWIGSCFDLLGDRDRANHYYKRAHGVTKELPRVIGEGPALTSAQVSKQVENIVNEFSITKSASVSVPKYLYSNLEKLDNTGTVNQTEEAIRWLGQYLGLNSTRPDNEHGTGPDNLWINDGIALVIEAKTNKVGQYTKDDIGQLTDHLQWVENNYPGNKKLPFFVGPLICSTKDANPSSDFSVSELTEFKALADKLIAAYEDIARRSMPIALNQEVAAILNERGLVWPKLLDDLSKYQLTELGH